jgi:hypothetical protein
MKKLIYLFSLLVVVSFSKQAVSAISSVSKTAEPTQNSQTLPYQLEIGIDDSKGLDQLKELQRSGWVVTDIWGFKEYNCEGPSRQYLSVEDAALDGCKSVRITLEYRCVLL